MDYYPTGFKILQETVLKEKIPKIIRLRVEPTDKSLEDMSYISKEADYLITQDGFPQTEFRCFIFQETYRNIIEQMLLTLEFTDK